jgi:hypothetical protein
MFAIDLSDTSGIDYETHCYVSIHSEKKKKESDNGQLDRPHG